MAFFSRRVILSIIVLATVGASGACSEDSEGDNDNGVQVVTTLPLFADMIENVGGERVEVTALLPAGADPHTWEPSPKDVRKVEDAEVAFLNGMDLEPAAEGIIEANTGDQVPVVRLAEESIEGLGVQTDDPHLWMNPDYAFRYISTIRDTLVQVDSTGKDQYTAGFDEYAAAIEAAGSYLLAQTSGVPDARQKLITTHNAFGHLADYIDFDITAFVAAGPGQEANPDDIQTIVEAVEDSGVPAVFTEPQVSSESKTLEQVAADTGAMVCELYSDSLDDEVSSYIELVRFNADEILRCLGTSNAA
jgi:ABC-type Zn uptake system ZnuABC Zn-binding protein ZnuA